MINIESQAYAIGALHNLIKMDYLEHSTTVFYCTSLKPIHSDRFLVLL